MSEVAASRRGSFAIAWIAIGGAVGYVGVSAVVARVSVQMLPWVLGRAFGVAAYLGLAVMTAIGLWLRHPWRIRRARWSGPAVHRAHALLAAVTLLFVAGHVVALAVDRYAGVGWSGAFVPGQSGYRPLGVALGTIGLYVALAVGLSARLAGWIGGRAFVSVHRLGIAAFVAVWLHGVLSGSDSHFLLPVYVLSGAGILVLALTRRQLTPPSSTVPSDHVVRR
jgi:methionine sulfoxide reductase heme-binding subunit